MTLQEAQRRAYTFLYQKTGREVRFEENMSLRAWNRFACPHTLILEDFIFSDEGGYSVLLFADSSYGGVVLVTQENVLHDNWEVIAPLSRGDKMSSLYAHGESVGRYDTKPWRLYKLSLEKIGEKP
jgi:hypothetical protein